MCLLTTAVMYALNSKYIIRELLNILLLRKTMNKHKHYDGDDKFEHDDNKIEYDDDDDDAKI